MRKLGRKVGVIFAAAIILLLSMAGCGKDKQETDSTKQKHAPVRKSAKQLFKYIIQTASDSDEAEIFSGSTHKNALTILLTR